MNKPDYLPDDLFVKLREEIDKLSAPDCGSLPINDSHTRQNIADRLARVVEKYIESLADDPIRPLVAVIDMPGLRLKNYAVFTHHLARDMLTLFANVDFLEPTPRPPNSWPLGTINNLSAHFTLAPDDAESAGTIIFMDGFKEVQANAIQLQIAHGRALRLSYYERILYEFPSNRPA